MMEVFTQLYIYNSWGVLVLRIVVGIIFLVHGLAKWRAWKMKSTKKVISSDLSLTRFLSLIEPLAGLGLIIGFFTPIISLVLMVIMMGAIFLKISQWKKNFSSEGGWEFELLILAVLLALLLIGPGGFSLDQFLFQIY